MWQHYKNTFTGMQIMIAVVAASVYLLVGRQPVVALIFFAVMQLSAVIGAVWGVRLKAIVARNEPKLLSPRE